MEENLKIPAHVALILDGNGRWAKKRGLPRQLGHKKGCETLEQVVEDAARLGIRYLTVYGFSTENWKRPEEEVGALMQLILDFFASEIDELDEKNVRILILGDKAALPEKQVEQLTKLLFDGRESLSAQLGIRLDTEAEATEGVGIPFHKGAAAYYKTAGITVAS